MQTYLLSRLRKLGREAAPPICVPVVEHPELEDWVHDSGRLVVIGEAAHPLPVRLSSSRNP